MAAGLAESVTCYRDHADHCGCDVVAAPVHSESFRKTGERSRPVTQRYTQPYTESDSAGIPAHHSGRAVYHECRSGTGIQRTVIAIDHLGTLVPHGTGLYGVWLHAPHAETRGTGTETFWP